MGPTTFRERPALALLAGCLVLVGLVMGTSSSPVLAQGASPALEAKLMPKYAGSEYFGSAVAISGDTLVIGAEGFLSPHAGSVTVFVRNGNEWVEQQQLFASDGSSGDLFGSSVAIDGETLVAGAAEDDAVAADAPAEEAEGTAG